MNATRAQGAERAARARNSLHWLALGTHSGHGIHQCLGQQLARVEMKIGYSVLLRRFPTLHLAVPPGEVPMRDGMFIYGVHRLPVAWQG